MTGVYESGPGWFSSHTDSVTDITQTDGGVGGFRDTQRGRDWWDWGGGGEGERTGGGGRERLSDSCSSNFYFSRSAVQLSLSHTHTGFPCFMGLSIYMMIFIMYILYILPPNPKMTPKHNSQKSLCICSMISVFLMGTKKKKKKKSPHKIKNFWYYYPFGDIMSPQHRAYLNHIHFKKITQKV